MDKLTSDDFKIIFIATGGVERLVIQHFERLPRPAILLADGMQNSLAAALEISTWLRGRGMKSEILHGELPAIIQRVHILYNNFRATTFFIRQTHRSYRNTFILVGRQQC